MKGTKRTNPVSIDNQRKITGFLIKRLQLISLKTSKIPKDQLINF